MTLTRLESFPFDSRYDGYDDNGYPVYDRAVGAHTMRDVFAHFFSDGVFSDTSYPFRITKASSGLAVTVNPGVIIINGGWGILPEQTTLTLATGTTAGIIKYAVFARYDDNDEHRTIYLRIDASAAGGTVPEPVTTEANVTEYRIGYITVPSNSTDLSSATVTNEVGTSKCPYAVPLFNIDAAEVLEDLRQDAQAAYDKYYELLASSVDDTTAGRLQNQIDGHDERIATLEDNQFTQESIDAKALRAEMGLGDTLGVLSEASGGSGKTDLLLAIAEKGVWIRGTVALDSSGKAVFTPPEGTTLADWTYVKLTSTGEKATGYAFSPMLITKLESTGKWYCFYGTSNAAIVTSFSFTVNADNITSVALTNASFVVEFCK